MSERDSISVHNGTLETLQSQQNGIPRRARPPDLEILAAEENRIPLRADRRRESRLGNLKNMFVRSKPSRDLLPLAPTPEATSPGIRSSIGDVAQLQIGGPPSEHTATTIGPRSPPPLTTVFEGPQLAQQPPLSTVPIRVVPPARPNRGSVATWNPPPLFKAFPQALKHMTLPSFSLPVETILRMQERRMQAAAREGSSDLGNASSLTLDENAPAEKPKPKKKHLRNNSGSLPKMSWTNKIYILVTSGYLLQYAAEGPFDRLPEKILHLGKNSAAFASDAIPGRHFVIQVSSSMELDGSGSAAPDSRSLLSRFPFRASDRRQASTFMMVFETAEDMEGWITALRREIEILGGKKKLAETGRPKAEKEAGKLREQPSQRTLVVRDPKRLSNIVTPWEDFDQDFDQEGSMTTVTETDANVDHGLDDVSTTNSFVSHDGRQLDNLRDSSNRLSMISSGQRTVMTSAGSSSPDASPVTDSFPAHFEDVTETDGMSHPEPKPRPNAAAIMDRRASMQVMRPFVDAQNGAEQSRPQSIYGSGATPDAAQQPASSRATPPNFSVPNSSNRRFSYVRNQTLDVAPPPRPVIRESESCPRLTARKSPPPPLPLARPASMAPDQHRPLGADEGAQGMWPTEDELFPTAHDNSGTHTQELPTRRSSLMPLDEALVEINDSVASRRLSGMRSSRPLERMSSAARNHTTSTTSTRPGMMERLRPRQSLPGMDVVPRCRSSLDLHQSSEMSSRRSRSQKRASMQSVISDHRSSQYGAPDFPAPLAPELLPQPAPPPSMPLPPIPTSASNPQLRVPGSGKGLLSRKSMPLLGEGPPPMPPPTCALPPIPQNPQPLQI